MHHIPPVRVVIGIGAAIVLSYAWMFVIGLVALFLPVDADPTVVIIAIAWVLAIGSAVVLDRYRQDPQAVREAWWRIEDRVLLCAVAACYGVLIWLAVSGLGDLTNVILFTIVVAAPAGRLLRRVL
jgi:hypothetical protein